MSGRRSEALGSLATASRALAAALGPSHAEVAAAAIEGGDMLGDVRPGVAGLLLEAGGGVLRALCGPLGGWRAGEHTRVAVLCLCVVH